MPPNKKSLKNVVPTVALEDLATLQNAVTPGKFAPLSAAAAGVDAFEPSPFQSSTETDASYWDWPVGTEEIKESAAYMLSTDNIVANMIRSAAEFRAKEQAALEVIKTSDGEDEDENQVNPEHDTYWLEGEPQYHQVQEGLLPSSPVPPLHQLETHLVVVAEDHNDLLDCIRTQEAAVRILSAASMEATEIRGRDREYDGYQQERRSHHHRHQFASDAYWRWEPESIQTDHADFWTWETPKLGNCSTDNDIDFSDPPLQVSRMLHRQLKIYGCKYEKTKDTFQTTFRNESPFATSGYWDW